MKLKGGAMAVVCLVLSVVMLCAFAPDVDNKDRVAIFKDIEVPYGITVNGDAAAIFGDVIVNGSITGDAVAIFGDVVVNGNITGDAVAIAGKISVKNSGTIGGDAVGVLGGVDASPNGIIMGEIVDIDAPFDFKRPRVNIPRLSYGDLIGLLVVYAFSCIALLIAPDRVLLMSEAGMKNPGRQFGIGILALMLFIPAALALSILFAITLIGIVFIPLIFVVFVLVAYAGMVAVEIAIGRRITGHLEGRNSPYIYLMIGVVIVYVLRIIPIVGWLAYIMLVGYALGVAVETRLGSPSVRRQTSDV